MTADNSRSGTKRLPTVVCGASFGAVLFFFALWLLDFPKPMVDDLFYCGAGLHLAAGGDLSNPFLARVIFPSHYFFVYPPLHSYALLGWLKMTGVSAGSMTAFILTSYLLIALSVIAILRRHGSPRWLPWMVPLAVATAFLPIGLRPEAFSVGLSITGFALVECGCTGSLPVFLAFLLMTAGGAVAPRMTPFETGLVAFALYRLWNTPGLSRPRRTGLIALMFPAAVIVVLFSMLMIQFRLREFWETFHYAAKMLVADRKLASIFAFFHELVILWQWPLAVITGLLALLAVRKRKNEFARLALFVAGSFFLAAAAGGIGYGTLWWILLLMLLLAGWALAPGNYPVWLPRAVQTGMILGFLVANRCQMAEVAGVLTGRIHWDVRDGQNTSNALQSTPEHALLVDTAVARYAFGYRTPPYSIDWGTTIAFPGGRMDVKRWKKGDVFLVPPAGLSLLLRYTFLDRPSPPVWSRFKLPQNPREVFIIPVEECRGIRPEFAGPETNSASQNVFGSPGPATSQLILK